MMLFVVTAVGRQPGGGSDLAAGARVRLAGRRPWPSGFALGLHDGRLVVYLMVRARDSDAARVRFGRDVHRLWPTPLVDATTTVSELRRRRRGWSVEWSSQDPGRPGDDDGGAGALLPRRPRTPVGPASAARRAHDQPWAPLRDRRVGGRVGPPTPLRSTVGSRSRSDWCTHPDPTAVDRPDDDRGDQFGRIGG